MPEPDRRSCDPPLILHIILLLTLFNGGESEANGLYMQVAAGGNALLPCHIKPAADATDQMVEWSKFDLEPRFVHVRRSGEDHLPDQNLLYKGRTSVPVSGLKQGDASLSLSKVRLSDEGKYKCYIPGLNTDTTVQLAVVAAIKITKTKIGVLECESRGWYPEPEVLWLDSKGNPLSAGPPETVRGPDDLYTVSSRVTVDKRHGNNFTCRVQQNNQHREEQITIPDDFFQESSRSTTSTIVGLIIGLLFILVVGFLGWKWRQTKTNTKNDNEPHQNSINQSTDPEAQPLMNKENEVKVEQITIPGTESPFVKKSRQNQEQSGGQTMGDMDGKETKETETPHPSDKGTCQEQPDQNEDKGNGGQAQSRTMDGKQKDTEREPETVDSNIGKERQEDAHKEPRKAGQNLMDREQQKDDKRLEAKNDKDKEEGNEEGQMTNQAIKGPTGEKTHNPAGGNTLEGEESTRIEAKNNTEVHPDPQKSEGEDELNSSANESASPEKTKKEQTDEEQKFKEGDQAKNDETVGPTEQETDELNSSANESASPEKTKEKQTEEEQKFKEGDQAKNDETVGPTVKETDELNSSANESASPEKTKEKQTEEEQKFKEGDQAKNDETVGPTVKETDELNSSANESASPEKTKEKQTEEEQKLKEGDQAKNDETVGPTVKETDELNSSANESASPEKTKEKQTEEEQKLKEGDQAKNDETVGLTEKEID